MPELIEHEANGLLAQTGNAASFVEALVRLIEDSGLRTRLGAAARRTVEERYTDLDVARQTVAVWRDASVPPPYHSPMGDPSSTRA